MKYLILPLLAITLFSCRGALISDDLIIVHKKHAIHKKYAFKYFYDCKQKGLKVRVYSNKDYSVGQSLLIELEPTKREVNESIRQF